MRPAFVRDLTCQGWVASRGIKGGSAPLARSYRGPDNVAGPLLGHLNPALAVVSAVPVERSLARRGRPRSGKVKVTFRSESGRTRFRHPATQAPFIIPLWPIFGRKPFRSWHLTVLLVLQTLDLAVMKTQKQFSCIDGGTFFILVITYLCGEIFQECLTWN